MTPTPINIYSPIALIVYVLGGEYLKDFDGTRNWPVAFFRENSQERTEDVVKKFCHIVNQPEGDPIAIVASDRSMPNGWYEYMVRIIRPDG